jgi:hypothetical protein
MVPLAPVGSRWPVKVAGPCDWARLAIAGVKCLAGDSPGTCYSSRRILHSDRARSRNWAALDRVGGGVAANCSESRPASRTIFVT